MKNRQGRVLFTLLSRPHQQRRYIVPRSGEHREMRAYQLRREWRARGRGNEHCPRGRRCSPTTGRTTTCTLVGGRLGAIACHRCEGRPSPAARPPGSMRRGSLFPAPTTSGPSLHQSRHPIAEIFSYRVVIRSRNVADEHHRFPGCIVHSMAWWWWSRKRCCPALNHITSSSSQDLDKRGNGSASSAHHYRFTRGATA